jgi:CheY-like chemotaxis protein
LSAFLKDMPKILLVEDNEMNRDMLSRRLQRKGYQVVLAMDGQNGVEMTQTEAPDLILMDMTPNPSSCRVCSPKSTRYCTRARWRRAGNNLCD